MVTMNFVTNKPGLVVQVLIWPWSVTSSIPSLALPVFHVQSMLGSHCLLHHGICFNITIWSSVLFLKYSVCSYPCFSFSCSVLFFSLSVPSFSLSGLLKFEGCQCNCSTVNHIPMLQKLGLDIYTFWQEGATLLVQYIIICETKCHLFRGFFTLLWSIPIA